MRALATGALLAGVLGVAFWVDPAAPELARRALLLAAAAAVLAGWRPVAPLARGVLLLAALDLLWHAFSASLALDPRSAWLGAPMRGLGVLDACAWWVIALGYAGADAQTRERIGALALGCSLALALLAWAEYASGWSLRPGATLGNAAFLGGVLALALPYWLLAPMPRALRWAALLVLGSALYLSAARGPMLAAAGGMLVAWIAFRPALRRSQAVALAALALVAAALIAQHIQRPDSVAIRLALYQAALAAQPEPLRRLDGQSDPWASWRPWIGYGPEQIEPVLTRRRDAELNRYEGQGWDRLADRTHNRLLDRWIALGIPGAALGVILGLWPLLRRVEDLDTAGRRRRSMAAGAWVAFGIDGLFGVPHAAVDLAAALTLGLLLQARGLDAAARAHWRPAWALLGAVACVAAALGWRNWLRTPTLPTDYPLTRVLAEPGYSALPGLLALERLYLEDRALAQPQSRDPNWLRVATQVSAGAPTLPRAWHLLAWLRQAHGDPDGAAQAWEHALALLDLAQAPNQPLALARARARLADLVHAQDPVGAQTLLRRATSALHEIPEAGRDADWQRLYGYVSARRGATRQAVDAYEAALRLDPADAASRANLDALRAAEASAQRR